jgi:hypothetical protein
MCETFWETSPAASIGLNGLLKIRGPGKTAKGTVVTHAPCLRFTDRQRSKINFCRIYDWLHPKNKADYELLVTTI